MSYYRKKPVLVEAVRWSGNPVDLPGIKAFCETAVPCTAIQDLLTDGGSSLIIPTLEGNHMAMPGDFIIKGVAGEFYPCKPDIFAATYEQVTP